jgi:hypothetical protein
MNNSAVLAEFLTLDERDNSCRFFMGWEAQEIFGTTGAHGTPTQMGDSKRRISTRFLFIGYIWV